MERLTCISQLWALVVKLKATEQVFFCCCGIVRHLEGYNVNAVCV